MSVVGIVSARRLIRFDGQGSSSLRPPSRSQTCSRVVISRRCSPALRMSSCTPLLCDTSRRRAASARKPATTLPGGSSSRLPGASARKTSVQRTSATGSASGVAGGASISTSSRSAASAGGSATAAGSAGRTCGPSGATAAGASVRGAASVSALSVPNPASSSDASAASRMRKSGEIEPSVEVSPGAASSAGAASGSGSGTRGGGGTRDVLPLRSRRSRGDRLFRRAIPRAMAAIRATAVPTVPAMTTPMSPGCVWAAASASRVSASASQKRRRSTRPISRAASPAAPATTIRRGEPPAIQLGSSSTVTRRLSSSARLAVR
jgi:hypothetical protein